MKNDIISLIYNSIDELNAQRTLDNQIVKSGETVLFGREGKLDSLGLVNLILSIEEAVNEAFNREIALADEKAMSQRNNPFQSVSSLADYIDGLINEGTGK